MVALGAAVALAVSACGADDGGDDGGNGDAPGGDAVAGAEAGPDVRVETIEVGAGPGPEEYQRVRVVEHGPEDAVNVLVLVPGTSAGAAYFTPVALDIVDALDGAWQVWSIDRRENLLEDHSVLERRVADEITSQDVFDYYLGWLGDDSITDHFEPVGGPAGDEQSVDFAREWGMSVAIDDLHAVIQEAVELGGEVVLGGHSLGGSITVAYATWDFDGRPGADDLSGIALIDGGSGAGQAPSVEEAEAQLAELAGGPAFNDIVGLGLPWAAGVFNALGSTAAVLEPDEPSLAFDSPLIPGNLKPPVHPTNAAQYGYALDTETSPDGLELVEMHMGRLADSGDPRGWVDDELVPVERAARMFSGLIEGPDGDERIDGIDGTAWYHPRRLSLDSDAVNGGTENPAQEVLGVRAVHGTELDLRIYALETSFGAGRVLEGARSLAEQSGIPESDLTLVDESDRLTHTDPMGVETSRNPLVETLVPFLGDLG